MSNPLTSLKKSRKIPLPNPGRSSTPPGRNIPYRNYTPNESQMLNEISSNMAAERLKDDRLPRLRDAGYTSSNGSSPRSNASGSTDHELMSLMMTRLGQLEQKLQFRKKELTDKDKQLRILEDKVRILQKARNDSDPGKVAVLERKCLLLQQQVHDMENFLNDYGMVWIGQKSDPDAGVYNENEYLDSSRDEDDEAGESYLTKGQVTDQLWSPTESVAEEFKIDFDLVLQNLQELNELAGEGVATIQHTTDGARLKMPDHIPLILYANGMVMFKGPFRPYSDKVTQLCMTDIMDGYFPAELQERYPDGVPFSVTDKRSVHFNDRLTQIFEGHAQPLGGDTKPSRLVPSNLDQNKSTSRSTQSENKSPREETSQLPGRQMTMEQFLQKLPASVIKEGKIIDVRNSVGNSLTGSGGPSGVTVIETDAVRNIKESLGQKQVPSAKRTNLSTLRIKNEKGDHTYILKMQYKETVGDIKLYLDRLRPKGSPAYQIVSTFPKQVYNDLSMTLEECQLVPNATLHLQPKKSR